MWAKSSTGRTKSTAPAIASDVVDRARGRGRDPSPRRRTGRAGPSPRAARGGRRAGRRRRRSPARARGRAGSPDGRRSAARRTPWRGPAVWSSIPSAILNFLPRSAWPMNAASGAWTERATSAVGSGRRAAARSRSRARSRRRSRTRRPGSPRPRAPRTPRVEASRLAAARRVRSGSLPFEGAYAVRPCFYVCWHAEAPFQNRPTRARHRPPSRRPLARDPGRERVESRGRRRLPPGRVRQGLLRRPHRGCAGLALPRARVPHSGPHAGQDAARAS